MRRITAMLALGASVFVTPASAEELAETATRFGARQTVSDIALSPSGEKILYVTPGQQSDETVYVYDFAAPNPEPVAITIFNESNARLSGCSWATEERIVCNVFGFNKAGDLIFNYSRMIAFKSDGGDVTMLSARSDDRTMGIAQDGGRLLALDVPGEDDRVLMTRRHFKSVGDNLSRRYSDKEGLGVDLVDIESGRAKGVEPPNRMAVNYIADENGRVRIMTVRDTEASGFDGSDVRHLYRPADSDRWEPLSVVDATGSLDKGFEPVAVSSNENSVYGFDLVDGYRALYRVKLDTGLERELVLRRDDVDVDRLIRIGRKGRIVGASYATEARMVEYFDPELDRLAGALAKALPGQPLISIIDASADEGKLLLAASSDTDPGMTYLYDRSSKALAGLLPLRDELDGREMAPMKPVTYEARDGTKIPAFLTLPVGGDGKNIPAVVLPHGGPGSRDVWGFDWLPQFLAARGFAVLQPNFRGSSGYGESWYGRNGFQAWETAVGDVNDAGRWLVTQGIADPDRLGIMGWSYGGYAALQSQALDPSLFQAVVAIAPVTDLDLLKEENRDYDSYAYWRKFVGEGAHISSGSPARHADKFEAPVLLVHGTMDLNVRVGQSRLMRQRLEAAEKQVDYLEFEGLDHYLVHSQARAIMLKRIGEFFAAELD